MSKQGLSVRALSEETVRQVHEASLEILASTGVRLEDETARSILADRGCRVQGVTVRIPGTVVEKALDLAPKGIPIWDREGRVTAMRLEGSNSYFGGGSDCPFTLDPASGERRKATLDDVAQTARLNDGLEHIDFIMSLALPQDLPPGISDALAFLAMVENTSKPICFTTFGPESLEWVYQAMLAFRDAAGLRQRPFAIHYAEPVSPLLHPAPVVAQVRFCAERGIPIVYAPGLMAGGTAPVTLAGTLALANAECLSGLVLSQAFAPGAPCIFGAFATVLDMKTTVFSHGAPELSLMSGAMSDLAHHYGLPCWSQAGTGDAKGVNAQAGAEYALSILMAALSGANLIHDCGFLDSSMTASLESCVLADEIISMVRRIVEGVVVSPETLAVDVVERVGIGGHFLMEDHTLRHMRREVWYPRLFERRSFESWARSGAERLEARMRRRAQEILHDHQPAPLSTHAAEALGRIRTDALATAKSTGC